MLVRPTEPGVAKVALGRDDLIADQHVDRIHERVGLICGNREADRNGLVNGPKPVPKMVIVSPRIAGLVQSTGVPSA